MMASNNLYKVIFRKLKKALNPPYSNTKLLLERHVRGWLLWALSIQPKIPKKLSKLGQMKFPEEVSRKSRTKLFNFPKLNHSTTISRNFDLEECKMERNPAKKLSTAMFSRNSGR